MPTLHLRITPLHNPQHYTTLGHALTELTARVLHKRTEVAVVTIDDLPPARYLIAGLVTPQPAAHLTIQITANTNSALEKSEFIAAAYHLLKQQLGDLHPASYVIVQEIPATDWGYSGLTQSARKAAKAM